MNTPDDDRHSINRRNFLAGTAAVGAASLLGIPCADAAELPPEISRIRIVHTPVVCFAPIYVAAEMLRLEGFT